MEDHKATFPKFQSVTILQLNLEKATVAQLVWPHPGSGMGNRDSKAEENEKIKNKLDYELFLAFVEKKKEIKIHRQKIHLLLELAGVE